MEKLRPFNTFATLSPHDFNRLSKFIYEQSGIHLNPLKKTMLESRLQKRLHALGMTSFKEYCDYILLRAGNAPEITSLINEVTTNKTDFFREEIHFNFLQKTVLPQFQRSHRGTLPLFRVWSAGCSTGEEPYTVAMVMQEYQQSQGCLVPYSILGTDLSTQVLQQAVAAVYSEEKTSAIPLLLKRKYFLRSKNPANRTLRIVPELRQKVSFHSLNLMDAHYEVSGSFDVIFCRNVLIYFDKHTQEKVINRLCSKLKPGGYLFLGHSESITNMRVPLQQIQPTIFRI